MKNAINYFYNMMIDDIHQNSKMYYFDYHNLRYALVSYSGDISVLNGIYNLHLEALKRGIHMHQIILNKDGGVATLINGVPYILMSLYSEDDGEINFDDLLVFFSTTYAGDGAKDRSDWGKLWADKIDYLEYEISQLGQKYSLVRESFSYFVGLAETAVQLVNLVNGFDGSERNSNSIMAIKGISHDRIRADDTLFDLYNPLNLVVDYRVRDMAEYFKHCYYEGVEISTELNSFLMYGGLTRDEYLLFFARMLYPTYYFDLYEDIISGAAPEEELKKIINSVNDYEQLLKSLYKYYKGFLNIFPIEWFE